MQTTKTLELNPQYKMINLSDLYPIGKRLSRAELDLLRTDAEQKALWATTNDGTKIIRYFCDETDSASFTIILPTGDRIAAMMGSCPKGVDRRLWAEIQRNNK